MTMQQLIVTSDHSTLLPTVLEPVILTPGDGAWYRIVSSLVRPDPPTRFFAITRGNDALIGDMFVLEPEVSFVDYIDRTADWYDLELLWAGWRAFLFLCGRPDQEAPEDLPRWQPDWYMPLTAVPIAVYQVPTFHRSASITICRTGPRAFSAAIADSTGQLCGEVLGCASAASALESASEEVAEVCR